MPHVARSSATTAAAAAAGGDPGRPAGAAVTEAYPAAGSDGAGRGLRVSPGRRAAGRVPRRRARDNWHGHYPQELRNGSQERLQETSEECQKRDPAAATEAPPTAGKREPGGSLMSSKSNVHARSAPREPRSGLALAAPCSCFGDVSAAHLPAVTGTDGVLRGAHPHLGLAVSLPEGGGGIHPGAAQLCTGEPERRKAEADRSILVAALLPPSGEYQAEVLGSEN